MIIVITLPAFIKDEVDAIVRQFDERGIDRLHIRKPGASEAEVEALVRAIPTRLYDRLTMHDHYALAQCLGLGGIHLTGRHPDAPSDWQGLLSTSCHSIEELEQRHAERRPDGRWRFDYLSLSPIFDSISKPGYQSAFAPDVLARHAQQGVIDRRVLALGGVTFDLLPAVCRMGFGGGMILGDAWRQF